MNGWVGRVIVLTVALVAATFAFPNTPTAEPSRFIPVVLSATGPRDADVLTGLAGSIDQVADSPDGLIVEGWVSRSVDEVTIIMEPPARPQRQEVLLLARPDVAAAGGGLFTGFRVEFAGVQSSDVRCVVFLGPNGAATMWGAADRCA